MGKNLGNVFILLNWINDTNIEQLSKVSHLSKEENYFKWEKITYNEKYQQNKITNADKALLKTLPA